MAERHVIITGTGRAGTTFLVQLLTHLGLDTGYDTTMLSVSPVARAGLEIDPYSLALPGTPYIVKSPFFCDVLEDVLRSGVLIDHAIVPVRRFEAAAASRDRAQQASDTPAGPAAIGGLWDVDAAGEQAGMLRLKFTTLVEVLVRYDIPTTFLDYPRHVRDPAYLYSKLAFLLGDTSVDTFQRDFATVAHPDWVHEPEGIDSGRRATDAAARPST